MPKKTIDRSFFKNRLALVRLADRCWRKPWAKRIPLINSSDLLSTKDKKALVSIGKQIGTDNFFAVFDQIDERGLKLSLPVVQFLRVALRGVPNLFPIVDRRRVAEANGYYLELRRLEGGSVEREIGLLDSNIPLISAMFENDGGRLRLSSVTVLSESLLSPVNREPLWVKKVKIGQLHSTAALVASNLTPSPTHDAGFVELAGILKKIQCLTMPRYDDLVEVKIKAPQATREDGKVLFAMPTQKQDCVPNGCTKWPDASYKDCCDAHDLCYCKGGNEHDRLQCDIALFDCVKERTNSAYAFLMYMGVRKLGVSHFNYHSEPDVTTTSGNPTPTQARVQIWLDAIHYTGDDIGNDTIMRVKFTVAPKAGTAETVEHKETDLGNLGHRSVTKCLYDKTFDDPDPLSYLQVWAKVKEKDVGPDDVNSTLIDYRRSGTTPIYPSHQWPDELHVLVSECCEGTADFVFYYRFSIQGV